ncbi:MAG: eL32 family ribosomal protein [Candidatus Diapherotrites archaeon]
MAKSAILKKIAIKIAKKKRKKFRGRFGKNSIRRKSIKKWQKWRYPRGADLEKTKQYTCMPSSGWRSRKETRGLHPSGYKEKIVRNLKELEMIAGEKETVAARIAATTGGRKRTEIIKKANELGIKVLN